MARKTQPRRLPLDDVFQQLLPRYGLHDACEDINDALRRNKARLWCGGHLVSPQYIRDQGLYVQVEPDAAGTYRCKIKSARPMEPRDYQWEVEGIEADQPPSRRGRRRGHDWPQIAGQIVRSCIKDSRVYVPKNESKLAADIAVYDYTAQCRSCPFTPLFLLINI